MPPTLNTISSTVSFPVFLPYSESNFPSVVSSSNPTIKIIEKNATENSQEIIKALFNKSTIALQKFLQEEKKYGSLF